MTAGQGKKSPSRKPKKLATFNPALDEAECPVRVQDLQWENIRTCLLRSRYVQVLLLLTIIGGILRFFHLDYNSLWLDEASTLWFAKKTIIGIWESTAGGEFNPPLFHWMEHAMLVFGQSEFVLRFLPAILGTLTIPVFYFVGKEWYDRNAGLIAAALLAFSPFHLFYSQEARAYAVVLFFFAIALVFFFRAVKGTTFSDWILFGIFSSLAFWTHFYIFIPLAILYLAAIVRALQKGGYPALRGPAVSVGTFILTTLPLLVVTFGLFFRRAAGGPAFGLQGMAVIYETVRQLSGFNDILTFVFLILFGIGTYVIWRERVGKAALLIALFIVPLIASVILSGIIPMVPRYLIYLLPLLFTGIGAAYNPFARALETGKITYVVIVILVLAQVPYLSSYYTTYSKDDWRGFARQVVQVTSPGDVVVLVPGYLDQPFDYYYSNTSDGTLEYGASERAGLERIAAMFSDRKMFIVLTPDIGAADQSGQTLQWLTDNTTVLSRWEKAIFLLQRK